MCSFDIESCDPAKLRTLKLDAADTPFVRQRIAHAYFEEDIASTVFLSKASFISNKRWQTKSDFPNRKGLIIDARINPYINISSLNWNFGKADNAWMTAIYFNPDFEVRLFDDDPAIGDNSKPVRTASFRPGAEIFISKVKQFIDTKRKYRFAYSFKINHHSNGQDGEVFNSEDRLWGKKGFVNTYNGDFSDDLLLAFNAMVFRNSKDQNHLFFLKTGYSTTTGITQQLAQYKLYGTDRLNLMSSWAWRPLYRTIINGKKRYDETGYHVERMRIELYTTYILNPMNVGAIYNLQKAKFTDRINFHVTGHWRVPGFVAAGLFVETGYYGQDTYNIYLQQSAWFAKFGLSFGLFKYKQSPILSEGG
ncbi:hypothetical protein [Pedobacter cryotolerans]|uniref:Uncharacterized protein n=1 Tax=Pedobacter cryotolerans TaxID=2571270 RepID=A0A4U1CB47_9SPHI|nr:hypothetical protein [Pedobacter cryotolerans]TKC03122.1 hypothetical protein FA045_00705 [Pedobacter cryotolerans]